MSAAGPARTSARLLFAFLLLAGSLAVRIPMALWRDLFFDERFTGWITSLPFGGIVSAIRHDSGPPLYYFGVRLVRLVFHGGGAESGRALALLAGVAAVAMLALVRRLGSAGLVAALLLAALPVHAYYSTEARAYSLAALFVGAAFVSLSGWIESGSRRSLIVGTAFLLAAAYTHYDAILFFPLPLIVALIGGPTATVRRPDRRRVAEGLVSSASLGIGFVPGFLLMRMQPVKEATGWMSSLPAAQRYSVPLSFAGPFPALASVPLPVSLILLVPMLVLLVAGTRNWLGRLGAGATVMPLLFALLLAMAGINVYYPLRFESILAVPFVLWLAAGAVSFPRRVGAALVIVLSVAGMAVCLRSAAEPSPPDPFYRSALALESMASPGETIVASGYCWLEMAAMSDDGWVVRPVAFPQEQAEHPGWRASKSAAELDRELAARSGSWGKEFFWIGEIDSPEARALARSMKMRGVFREGGVGVARVSR